MCSPLCALGAACLGLVLTCVAPLAAQPACRLPIPQNAVVVNAPQRLNAGRESAAYWICSGGNLTIGGGNNTYYVESFGRLYVSGGIARVYLKAGATLVMDFGAEVSVVYDPSAQIRDESITSDPEKTECRGLSFIYTDAPAEGCPGIQREPDYSPADDDMHPPALPLPEPQAPVYQAMLVPISSAALLVSMPRRMNATSRQLWVCSSGQLQLFGNNNIVFLEPGATLTLAGSNNLVYARSGARVRYASGNDNLVLAEQGTDVQHGNWGEPEWQWGYGWYGPHLQRKNKMKWKGMTDPGRTPGAPPRLGQDQERLTVGAIGPPYPTSPIRLEWLEYLEFDTRALGYAARCR